MEFCFPLSLKKTQMEIKQVLKSIRKGFLIVFVLLALTEGILRIFQIGGDNLLFVESNTNSEILEVNNHFVYDLNSKTSDVKSSPIKKVKDKNTFRIFVLGKPADPSLPQNPNSTFSHILKYYLQRSFPDKNIELVNIAFNSAHSFLQYDISKQIINYQADVVFAWPGGDEFNVNNPQHIWLHRMAKNFQQFRLVQGIQKLLPNLKNSSNNIEPDKQLYSKIISNFETNLSDMVTGLQNYGIKVVLMNNASNLLNMAPQKSCFTRPDSSYLQELYKMGEEEYLSNKFEKAHHCFSKLYQKDKAHAGTCFYLGKLAYMDHNYAKAKKFFELAIERDHLKPRVPTEINNIIFKIAAIKNCQLVDVVQSFAAQTATGIPGNNLFTGAQQVNLTGNIIIATECYKTLLKDLEKLKVKENDITQNYSITAFDSIYERISSEKLKGNQVGDIINIVDSQIVSTSFEEKTTNLFAEKKVTWEESMNALYQHYIENRNYTKAFRVIESLALENPYDLGISTKASKAASFLGDSQLVIHYARKVYSVKPDVELANLLFINYLQLDMPEDALPYLVYIRKNKTDNDINFIYTITCQVIDLKKLLEKNPDSKEIRNQIANRYNEIGNYEIALIYEKASFIIK